MHNLRVYDYGDGALHDKTTYRRGKDIARAKLTDALSRFKGALARFLGFDGACLPLTGTACLEKMENGVVTERACAPAVWELMYLGHTQEHAALPDPNKRR